MSVSPVDGRDDHVPDQVAVDDVVLDGPFDGDARPSAACVRTAPNPPRSMKPNYLGQRDKP